MHALGCVAIAAELISTKDADFVARGRVIRDNLAEHGFK
jgi:hypothetical protein